MAGQVELHRPRRAGLRRHPTTGNYLDNSDVARELARAQKAAGVVDPVSFHGLRHTFGNRCAAAGIPMRTLQAWLGHKRTSTTEIYAGYAPAEGEADMVEAAFS